MVERDRNGDNPSKNELFSQIVLAVAVLNGFHMYIVHMCICIHIYTYIHIYIHIYIYIYIYIFKFKATKVWNECVYMLKEN